MYVCVYIGPRLNIGRQVIRDVARTPEVDDFDLAPTHKHANYISNTCIIMQLHYINVYIIYIYIYI